MTNDTARILANCLDALEQGQPLEECVARYSDQRLTLGELLPVAQMLRSAPAVMPSLDFRLDARQHLLARLPPRRQAGYAWRTAWFTKRVTLLRVTIMLLLGVGLATSVVTASAQALPNDVLYPVKRTIEQARLALAAKVLRVFEVSARREAGLFWVSPPGEGLHPIANRTFRSAA